MGKKRSGKHPHRKYLSKLGVHADADCVFNTEADGGERRSLYEAQRREMGFDQRETWSMDYTLATWLYSHFMWYEKNADVDLDFHKVRIPTWNPDTGKTNFYLWEEVTQRKAIDIVTGRLASFIGDGRRRDDADYADLAYALHVAAEVMRYMWW